MRSKRPLQELNPVTEHARTLACVDERKRFVHAVDIINTENTDECAHHSSVRAVRTAHHSNECVNVLTHAICMELPLSQIRSALKHGYSSSNKRFQ